MRDDATAVREATLPAPPALDLDAVAFFIDIDGTLLDFATRPEDVRVEPGLADSLVALRTRVGGALALVSGRELVSIDTLFPQAFAAGGMHGAEVRFPDGRVVREQVAFDGSALRARADTAVAAMRGVLVEHKQQGLAIHYRAAPEYAGAVASLATALVRDAGAGFELQRGSYVVELKSAMRNKGTAVTELMREAPFAGRRPYAIGDDLTDEHAFAGALALGGSAIIVGARRPTRAPFALASPAAARAWLAAASGR